MQGTGFSSVQILSPKFKEMGNGVRLPAIQTKADWNQNKNSSNSLKKGVIVAKQIHKVLSL